MDDKTLMRLILEAFNHRDVDDPPGDLVIEEPDVEDDHPTEPARRLAALIRAEVLEEAARICDRGTQVSPDRRVGVGCARCATAIRAAKEGV